jgi:NAD(P)-dependent dehydrogenase (short-subunit alcohol dehydrogenase family)
MAQLAEELLGEGMGWVAVRLAVGSVCAALLAIVAILVATVSSGGGGGSKDNGEATSFAAAAVAGGRAALQPNMSIPDDVDAASISRIMDEPEDNDEQEERERAIVDLCTGIKERRATLAQLERDGDAEERGAAPGGSEDHEMDEGVSSRRVRELQKTLGRMRETSFDDMAEASTQIHELKKAKDAIQAELGASKQMLHRMRETSFDDMAEASTQINKLKVENAKLDAQLKLLQQERAAPLEMGDSQSPESARGRAASQHQKQQQQHQQQQQQARLRAAASGATAAANSVARRCLIAGVIVTLLWLLMAYISAVAITPKYTVSDPATSAVAITGCSQGIGQALAYRLAEGRSSGGGGYAAVFAGVRGGDDAAAALLRNAPSDAVRRALKPIQLDVTDDSQIAAAVQHIETALITQGEAVGVKRLQLAALVNNAGVGGWSEVREWDREGWRRVFDVNVFGAAALSSAVLPLLTTGDTAAKGRVVHIGSISGVVLAAVECPYAASKYALEALADAMRLELGLRPHSVAVSLVQPGWVATPLCPPSACPGAAGTGAVEAAVLHALSSPRPLARYVVTSVDGIPTSLLLWLAWALPDYWQDAVVRTLWED